jgi:glycosyltransferase involved in cell wall biosynthesis
VSERVRCEVVLEQTLGHVTHGQNLRRLLPERDDLDVTFVPIPFEVEGLARLVPGWNNWTIRAGARARRRLRAAGRRHPPPDVRFVHTQVPAVLLGRALEAVPTVVSLDATPLQYDSLGEHYQHAPGPAALERLKTRLNRRCFERAAHIVTWAQWTKDGLVADYGIGPERITVIAPGVDTARWRGRDGAPDPDGPVRILFVGGDLRRKGGHHLLEAFEHLRSDHGERVELHLATPTPVDERPGVTVHATMTPNSPELIDLYHRCDVFCLPTLGDCLPMVLPEAAAAGLAIVSTSVGAIPEIVRHEETGLLVEVGEVAQLAAALDRLVRDEVLRTRAAAAAGDLVGREHDAAVNAGRLAALLTEFAAPR